MRVPRSAFPNAITLVSGLLGFLAVLRASVGDTAGTVWLLVAAGVLDVADGSVARLLRASTRFGIELDSLTDLLSFGVAPSLLAYQVGLKDVGVFGAVLASLPTLCGAFRLARFNVELGSADKNRYTGLPIPPAAVTLCSFLLLETDRSGGLTPLGRLALPYVVAALSVLMASRVPYYAVPAPSRNGIRSHPVLAALFTLGALAMLVTLGRATFWVMVCFVLSPIGRLVDRRHPPRVDAPPPAP